MSKFEKIDQLVEKYFGKKAETAESRAMLERQMGTVLYLDNKVPTDTIKKGV